MSGRNHGENLNKRHRVKPVSSDNESRSPSPDSRKASKHQRVDEPAPQESEEEQLQKKIKSLCASRDWYKTNLDMSEKPVSVLQKTLAALDAKWENTPAKVMESAEYQKDIETRVRLINALDLSREINELRQLLPTME